MKVNFMGYEIEIKAKNGIFNNRYNKKDTLAAINAICCLMIDSADKARMNAANANARGDKESEKIYSDYLNVINDYFAETTACYEELKYNK